MGLLVAQTPCTVRKLQNLFAPAEKVSGKQIDKALEILAKQSENKTWEIVKTASGWQARTKKEHAKRIQQFLATSPPRLSRPLMEVLAIVAYNQPVTRGEIEAIRGVSTSANQLTTLEEFGWIEVSGRKETPGRPLLYATTKKLLDDLGMTNLTQLPPLEEFEINNLNIASDGEATAIKGPSLS